MKKLKLSLVLSLALAVIFALSACTFATMQTCTVHRDLNKDTYCDVCGSYVPVNCTNHLDENHDGMCDTKGCTVMLTPMHYDNDCNGKCDAPECGKTMKIKHEDSEPNGFCDKCGTDLTLSCEHEDEDQDDICDKCSKELPKCQHTDENRDGFCDICDREIEVTDCEHADSNYDGKCDKCKINIPGTIPLVRSGIMNFQFVLYSGAPISNAQAVDILIQNLEKIGVSVKERAADNAASIQDYEILIGNCTSRGEEYCFDEHFYGPKGYAIKVLGNKIVVLWGSEDTFDDAMLALQTEIIGLTEGTSNLRNRYITDKNAIEVVQDDYKVTTLTLNGQDMRGFTIAVDKSNKTLLDTALELQTMFYNDTGYWFDIVDLEDKDRSIVITLEDKNPDPEQRFNNKGFKVSCLDNRIEVVSEYVTAYMPIVEIDTETEMENVKKYRLTRDYFSGKINAAEKEGDVLDFVSETDDYEEDIRYVYYKDYGADGFDGNDDAEAIRAAHEYANLGGHKVVAEAGANYDIGLLESSIIVQTDVDWKDATFNLHDYKITPDMMINSTTYYRNIQIFTILREEGAVSIRGLNDKKAEINAAGGLDASSFTSFNFNFGRPMLVYVCNSYHANYIRYGVNASEGGGQKEVVMVDKDGNLDPSTPLMFDYEYVTALDCYPIDDLPIIIEGGKFVTNPFKSDEMQDYTAYSRGLQCARSNVTFKNVKHIITDEGNYNYNNHNNTEDYGCPYGGFYNTSNCNNIRYLGCQASAHIVYKGSNGAGMGTYDVSPGNSTNIVFEECYQEEANFFDKTYVKDANGNPTSTSQTRWGVMGSSGNKNITFLNSRLTRMDAHGGAHNIYIIGTEIRTIRVDGTGIFYMEDSVVHNANPFIGLREDYGGFWDGNLIIKDCVAVGRTNFALISNTWYNHYFGYPTSYPANILVDNLKVGKLSSTTFYGDGSDFTPYDAPTVSVFGNESTNSGGSQILTGFYHAAHIIEKDYLPATSDNNVTFFADGSTRTDTSYYENGKEVVVANKNQTPAPERLIIKNCDDTITFNVPDKARYPWFENTYISVNKATECEKHFDCFGDGDNLCDDCGEEMPECTEHYDGNYDGRCAYCFIDVEIECEKHIDKDLNGMCDTCREYYICSGHVDPDEDTICDICGGVLGCPGQNHKDANEDGYCDVCTKLIPLCDTCVDEKKERILDIPDGKCDICKADMVDIIDPCDECSDADHDQKCDRCLKPVACEHTDVLGNHVNADGDENCDSCSEAMSSDATCTANTDGVCDWCKETMPAAE